MLQRAGCERACLGVVPMGVKSVVSSEWTELQLRRKAHLCFWSSQSKHEAPGSVYAAFEPAFLKCE